MIATVQKYALAALGLVAWQTVSSWRPDIEI
jgi:hypothetical protein